MSLAKQLAQLPRPLLERLEARGFAAKQLQRWSQTIGGDPRSRNRLPGAVEPIALEQIPQAPQHGSDDRRRHSERGRAAIEAGELAICVLAGGMATRMGGVVKALVEIDEGIDFLAYRLAERRSFAPKGGNLPLWLMTSEPTHTPIGRALAERAEQDHVAAFEQFVALRLTLEGGLWLDDEDQPSVYATGHGDLPDALRRSGLLQRFVDAGGRYIWISNIDNIGASIDPALLGQHIAADAELTVELVDKHEGDAGGGPVLHDGRPIIAEHFRLPEDFDHQQVPVFNTNTFLVDARALAKLELEWSYLEVHKSVAGGTAVQFERLLGELTMAMPTRFVRVSRQGSESRFVPVKNHADLERARPALRRMAQARSIRL
jgi:UTP--glucose-1-phosphate uridylyltransferase